MTNEIVKYQDYKEPQGLAIIPKGDNYLATYGTKQIELVRDRDFGLIPTTKKPSLYLEGAEKILALYGLLERAVLESFCEDHENGYYFYRFRVDLIQMVDESDGLKEVVVKSGWGSANTRETRNGFKKSHDCAHNAMLMAYKRAKVYSGRSIARLAGIFDVDMENQEFLAKAEQKAIEEKPDEVISSAKVKRIFGMAQTLGLPNYLEKTKAICASFGYTSRKAILNKDYDAIIEAIQKAADENKVCKAIEEGK